MNDTEIKLKIEDLEKRMFVLEKAINPSNGSNTPPIQNKELSLREFLISKKPSDDVKKTLAIGYFLEKYQNVPSFNSSDLMDAYEKSKEKKPLNIHDKVNMNIKNGHLDEVKDKKDNKKSWHLTNSGEAFVESDFQVSK